MGNPAYTDDVHDTLFELRGGSIKYPEPKDPTKRPLGAQMIQQGTNKHTHKWILTKRLPEYGYYGKNKNKVDFEFVCPECEAIKKFTKEV